MTTLEKSTPLRFPQPRVDPTGLFAELLDLPSFALGWRARHLLRLAIAGEATLDERVELDLVGFALLRREFEERAVA